MSVEENRIAVAEAKALLQGTAIAISDGLFEDDSRHHPRCFF